MHQAVFSDNKNEEKNAYKDRALQSRARSVMKFPENELLKAYLASFQMNLDILATEKKQHRIEFLNWKLNHYSNP